MTEKVKVVRLFHVVLVLLQVWIDKEKNFERIFYILIKLIFLEVATSKSDTMKSTTSSSAASSREVGFEFRELIVNLREKSYL
jgi:hypothetical protein